MSIIKRFMNDINEKLVIIILIEAEKKVLN